ncbi:MAG: PorV/PorQ family protein [Fidelibacterota bacterium]|nr:MAG: PorV/PorQ family protein [Candidatus Neomarinimicrobiota bacterium]
MAKTRLKTVAMAAFIAVALVSFASAQGPRNGTSGASYLLIPQGARYLSGGGATANAVGIDAIYWNPAGLARAEAGVSAIFSRRNYIADIGIDYFGAAVKFGRLGSVGIAARIFDIGEIDVTDIYFPDGTGEKFTPNFFAVALGYSKLISDRTSIGLNVNLLNEGFTGVVATGMTLDAGVQYSSFLNIPGLAIGVALKNFGTPMRYGGSRMWVEAAVSGSDRETEWYKITPGAFDMPFVMDIGLTYRLNLGMGHLDIGGTFENNHSAQDEIRLLGEFTFGELASVRFANMSATSVSDNDNTPDVDESEIENIWASYSFGATLNLKQFTGLGLSIDYAFIATKFFDDNQIFALRLDL